MSRTFAAGPLCAAGLVLLALSGSASAQGCGPATTCAATECSSCGMSCWSFLARCFEWPVCVCVKKTRKHPICHPCKLNHFGYYPTCWSPWPYAADYSHCACQVPVQGAPVHEALPAPAMPPAGTTTTGVVPTAARKTDDKPVRLLIR